MKPRSMTMSSLLGMGWLLAPLIGRRLSTAFPHTESAAGPNA